MSQSAEARSERVDLRMTPKAKQMLQHAAAAANKTLTEFLLDSGLHAARDTLADRRTFIVNAGAWDRFTALLDAPPTDTPQLRALLDRKPAWQK